MGGYLMQRYFAAKEMGGGDHGQDMSKQPKPNIAKHIEETLARMYERTESIRTLKGSIMDVAHWQVKKWKQLLENEKRPSLEAIVEVLRWMGIAHTEETLKTMLRDYEKQAELCSSFDKAAPNALAAFTKLVEYCEFVHIVCNSELPASLENSDSVATKFMRDLAKGLKNMANADKKLDRSYLGVMARLEDKEAQVKAAKHEIDVLMEIQEIEENYGALGTRLERLRSNILTMLLERLGPYTEEEQKEIMNLEFYDGKEQRAGSAIVEEYHGEASVPDKFISNDAEEVNKAYEAVKSKVEAAVNGADDPIAARLWELYKNAETLDQVVYAKVYRAADILNGIANALFDQGKSSVN
ncbi:MAG: hypothetical protein Q7T16_02945 [Candidatus Burarchaeum sp.]|nr:hypothetical protein [Candidatus Burarchaeum sp.]MDO8339592.1 hypothetical protein [Candidatus Burarchaeum sp.]